MNNIISEVQPVSAKIGKDHFFQKTDDCLIYNFQIGSSMDKMIQMVQKLDELLIKVTGINSGLRDDLSLVLSEALNNAIIHGNNAQPDKIVDLMIQIYKNKIVLKVKDEGQGFNYRDIPNPLDTANKVKTHGRGVYLMSILTDEIKFTKHTDGMEVEMVKYILKR